MMRTCAKVRIAADNLALRLNVTKPIFLSFLYKLLEKMNFPQGSCLYKTDASKKRGGRTWMKRIL